jgi:actin related protein 2/3 complex subunit 3
LTLYITEYLGRLQKVNFHFDYSFQSCVQAQKELTLLAISAFPILGDADFPLNGMFTKPTHNEVRKFSFR